MSGVNAESTALLDRESENVIVEQDVNLIFKNMNKLVLEKDKEDRVSSLPSTAGRWYRVDMELIEELKPLVFKYAPIGIKDTLDVCPPERKMNTLSALMPICGMYADSVELVYNISDDPKAAGEEQCLAFLVAIIAKGASGKHGISTICDRWLKTLDEEERAGFLALDAWKDQAQAQEKVAKPHPVIRNIACNAGQAYIFECLKNAQGHCCVSVTEESDDINTGTNNAWNQLSTIIRKAFGQEIHKVGRVSQDSVSFNGKIRWNLTILGTPGTFNKFFTGNTENGLPTRFIISFLEHKIGDKPPVYKQLSPKALANIEKAIEILRNCKGEVKTPKLNKAIAQWVEGKRLLSLEHKDEVLDQLKNRCAVIGWRCGVIAHILSQKKTESQHSINMALLMAEYALMGQMAFFAKELEKNNSDKKNQIPNLVQNYPAWLLELPENEVFSIEEARKIRIDISEASLKRSMRRYVERGYVKKVSNNHWIRLAKK